jgi:prepilin-type N-terminal cleavage/methylation domain-containing protein
MNIRNVSSKKGFTLMELLVVITLLALTGAGFLVQAIHARNISNLDVAKNMLVGALNEAQAKGRGGMRVPDPFVEEKFDAGFGVYV